MMTSGFSTVGRYGTISLMNNLEPGAVVTGFGIDTDQLTFGRDSSCSVRLYYPDVSPLHCKIVFEENKAFLVVLGASGLLVDGCEVYPKPDSNSPTTVALSNNSEIEIHSKRFRFSYPPKELRPQLYASPARPPQRKLRLSMINSAQVFSPRPSPDPQENLKVLQSPLRQQSLPASPLPDNSNEGIVLVDGNNPKVVEQGSDLVIVEDIPVREVFPILNQPPLLNNMRLPPLTPLRKARPTLHKAVLLRSAHKVFEQREAEKREEEEEMEVTGTVLSDDIDSSSEDDEPYEDDKENGLHEVNEEGETEGEIAEEESTHMGTSTWRTSLERVWPFSSPQSDVREEEKEENGTLDVATAEIEETSLHTRPLSNLGLRFMTPQLGVPSRAITGRMSLGGQPRRVAVEEKWKVADIVLPVPEQSTKPVSPIRKSRGSLTAEERKAIQERRRSALKDDFFATAAPGMSPTKVRPRSVSPSKVDRVTDSDDGEMDTKSLLESMKKTVQNMKRRSSIRPGGFNLLKEIREREMDMSDDDDVKPMDEGSKPPEIGVTPLKFVPYTIPTSSATVALSSVVENNDIFMDTSSPPNERPFPATMTPQQNEDGIEKTMQLPSLKSATPRSRSTPKDASSSGGDTNIAEAPKLRTRGKPISSQKPEISDTQTPKLRKGRKTPSVERNYDNASTNKTRSRRGQSVPAESTTTSKLRGRTPSSDSEVTTTTRKSRSRKTTEEMLLEPVAEDEHDSELVDAPKKRGRKRTVKQEDIPVTLDNEPKLNARSKRGKKTNDSVELVDVDGKENTPGSSVADEDVLAIKTRSKRGTGTVIKRAATSLEPEVGITATRAPRTRSRTKTQE